MSIDVQGNAKAIIAAVTTLEDVEERCKQVDDIVRGALNDHNIVKMSNRHGDQIVTLIDAVKALNDSLAILRADIAKIGKTHDKITTNRDTMWTVLYFLAWVITSGIAIFAAFNNGK